VDAHQENIAKPPLKAPDGVVILDGHPVQAYQEVFFVSPGPIRPAETKPENTMPSHLKNREV